MWNAICLLSYKTIVMGESYLQIPWHYSLLFTESEFFTLLKAIPLKFQGIVPRGQIVFLVPACLLYMLLVVTVIRRN